MSTASQPKTIVFDPAPPPPTIFRIGDSLFSSAQTGNQWYIDTSKAIDSATGHSYLPKEKGLYSVRVTTNGCSGAFSALFDFTPSKTSTGTANVINVGPNPAGDHIVINFDVPGANTVTVMIFDLTGKQNSTTSDVHNQQSVDIAGLAPGLYFVRVLSPDGKSLKTVKIYKPR